MDGIAMMLGSVMRALGVNIDAEAIETQWQWLQTTLPEWLLAARNHLGGIDCTQKEICAQIEAMRKEQAEAIAEFRSGISALSDIMKAPKGN